MCSHYFSYNLFLLQHILSYVAHSISEKEKQACLHKGNKFPTVHCITQNMMLGCSVSPLKRSNPPGFSQVHLQLRTASFIARASISSTAPTCRAHLSCSVHRAYPQSPLLLRLLRTRTSPPPLTTECGVPPLPLSKSHPRALCAPLPLSLLYKHK